MIIIQSESGDASTNDIINWLCFLNPKVDIKRLDGKSKIEKFNYSISDEFEGKLEFNTNGEKISNSKVKKFWYRRGYFDFQKKSNYDNSINKLNKLNPHISYNFNKEQGYLVSIIYSELNTDRINTFAENFTNKIQNLSVAKFCGLNIPATFVTNSSEDLKTFSKKFEFIINKDIEFDPIRIKYSSEKDILLVAKVIQLSFQNLENLYPKDITLPHPSLYQEYIEKQYEIRVFYFKKRIYSMAIFSQQNEKTKIDFRNYDLMQPNRCVPYSLPKSVEKSIIEFMTKIQIECGSLDIIYSSQEKYVFLEVNPIGKFQWLSKNCNYDIEKQIAIHLLKNCSL